MSLDNMTDAEITEKLNQLERSDYSKLNTVRTLVKAFMENTANRDLGRTLRKGLIAKVVLAVFEGETLTKDSWLALAGYGREYLSSFDAHGRSPSGMRPR